MRGESAVGSTGQPLVAGCDGSRSAQRIPSLTDASSGDTLARPGARGLASFMRGCPFALGPNLVSLNGCVNVRRVTAVIKQ